MATMHQPVVPAYPYAQTTYGAALHQQLLLAIGTQVLTVLLDADAWKDQPVRYEYAMSVYWRILER